MGLRFVYGAYVTPEHYARPASLSITPRLVNGYPIGHVWTLNCEVLLLATPGNEPMADLTSQAAALTAALQIHDQSGGLQFTTDGINWSNTHHYLSAVGAYATISPSPININPSQLMYATELWCNVQIVAEYGNALLTQTYLRMEETVEILGQGGALTVLRPQWNAASVQQEVRPYTDVQVVQSGIVVGRAAYPSLPSALVTASGAIEVTATRDRKSTVQVARAVTEYQRAYSYKFNLNAHPGTLTPRTLNDIWA